jgi:hypothetical protein
LSQKSSRLTIFGESSKMKRTRLILPALGAAIVAAGLWLVAMALRIF